MDLLNNINVVIGIIVGLITIGTTIFGGIKFLQKKASSSLQGQAARPSPSLKQPSNQVVPPLLSKLDWMEVLWSGFEDCLKAKDGGGWFISLMIGIFGGFFIGLISSSYSTIATIISLTIFFALFLSANILFYVYFVGRRIEKKFDTLNQPIIPKAKRTFRQH